MHSSTAFKLARNWVAKSLAGHNDLHASRHDILNRLLNMIAAHEEKQLGIEDKIIMSHALSKN